MHEHSPGIFQNKRKGIAILLSCMLGFFAAWFGIPAAVNTWSAYTTYLERSVIPVSLSDEEKKKHEQSLADIKSALRDSDKQGNATYGEQYTRLAEHYEALGYLGKAAHAYDRAWNEGAVSTETLLSMARVQQGMKYFDKAEKLYRDAVQRAPTRIDTYHKLANLYFYDLSDQERARGTYIEGLDKTGNHLELMKLFATYLELSGERREAYIYWDAVLKKDRQNKTVEAHLKTFSDLEKNN